LGKVVQNSKKSTFQKWSKIPGENIEFFIGDYGYRFGSTFYRG
jgi:hypothetical protein